MHIEIQIPRPGALLLLTAAVSGWAMYFTGSDTSATVAPVEVTHVAQSSAAAAPAAGAAALPQDDGHGHFAASVIEASPPADPGVDLRMSQAEMRMRWARAEQDFLRQREEILRTQLETLQSEREALGDRIDPALEEQFRRSVRLLTSLVQDRQKSEQFLLAAYKQMWEAEERAMAITTGAKPKGPVAILWPVEPKLGISAGFLDEAYRARFKVDHYAIDIPILQGSTVLAAADGVVTHVVDHGLGYNYVTIDHGGYATTYGHMSAFAVREGQRVRAGDKVGDSGGMPGLPGGGSSTGPHLHFALSIEGTAVDPLKYLPKL